MNMYCTLIVVTINMYMYIYACIIGLPGLLENEAAKQEKLISV